MSTSFAGKVLHRLLFTSGELSKYFFEDEKKPKRKQRPAFKPLNEQGRVVQSPIKLTQS